MNRHILTATAAALLLGSTVAWAGNDVKGTVQSINAETQQITLNDGKTYKAAAGVNLASLKAGDSVTIQTEDQNGETVVTK
jgi:Cu/Ag efflux protein CusF